MAEKKPQKTSGLLALKSGMLAMIECEFRYL